MEKTTTICDQCGDEVIEGEGSNLNWLRLTAVDREPQLRRHTAEGNSHLLSSEKDFCSGKCLVEWFAKLLAVPLEPKGGAR